MFATRLVLWSHTHQSEEGSGLTSHSVQFICFQSFCCNRLTVPFIQPCIHSFILMWQWPQISCWGSSQEQATLVSHGHLFLWNSYIHSQFVFTFLTCSKKLDKFKPKKTRAAFWYLNICDQCCLFWVMKCCHCLSDVKSCLFFPILFPLIPSFRVLVWPLCCLDLDFVPYMLKKIL